MTGSVARDIRRVRVRITAVATLTLVVILVIAGYALLAVFERDVMRQVDARLIATSDRIAQLAANPAPLPSMGSSDDLIQVVDGDGAVTYSSGALQGESAMWVPGDGERQPRTVQTSSQGPLRVTAFRFQDRWIVMGDSVLSVQEDAASLQRAMLIGLLPLAMALALLVWVVAGRALRPVTAAVEHEEQLVGDVSHELRSPLAGLRVLLETEPDELQAVELSRIEALATLSRLETISEQLLVLSRQDQPRGRAKVPPVDLDEIVLHQVHAIALRSPVRLDVVEVAPGQVSGRGDDLEGMVENLLSNAVRHARTVVRVSLYEDGPVIELVVEDDGPGISLDDRDRVFERFTRLDEARSRDRGGTGLGLAIARAIADAHGGSIAVGESDLGGARFVVRLPASTSGTASPATSRGTVRLRRNPGDGRP